MANVIDYVRDKNKDFKKTIIKGGIIKIYHNQINYEIDPATILVGMIDDDANKDAIISIASYNGQSLVRIEHLILIKTDGKFKITKVIEGDMKIIGIKDRVIFAEIPKVAPDAPTHSCSVCKEVVKYQYKDGNIVRTDTKAGQSDHIWPE